MFARAIHSASRRKGPLYINCSAIPTTLESEMFGYGGAFTGALKGKVESMNWQIKGRFFWMKSRYAGTYAGSYCVLQENKVTIGAYKQKCRCQNNFVSNKITALVS